MDFFDELMALAGRIAVEAGSPQIGTREIWQALLYLAHHGNEQTKDALNRHFGERDWTTEIPALRGAPPPPSDLPLAPALKPSLGRPLGALHKLPTGPPTPDDLIKLLSANGVLQQFGVKSSASPPHPFHPATPSAVPPKDLATALKVLASRLEDAIYGQTSALRAFVSGMDTSLHRPDRKGKLRGSFLVFGPHGCGKGELARVLEDWVKEHKDCLPVKSLIYFEGYLFTSLNALRARIRNSSGPPIIVLSDFEKYEATLRDVLMDGLDRAVLELPDDGKPGTLSTPIEGAVVILMGNVGQPLWERLPFKETEMLPDRERIKEALEQETIAHRSIEGVSGRISRAFLDRVDCFIPMCQLRYADVTKIVSREIATLTQELLGDGVTLHVEPRVRDLVVLASYYHRPWSGRQAHRGCREYIEGPVRRLMSHNALKSIEVVCADKSYNAVMDRSVPRLLLLDDEHESLTPRFQKALAGVANVDGCADVGRAVELAAEHSFDLLLLDLYFNGQPRWREYLAEWRKSFPQTPVVLLSGGVVPASDRLEIDRLGGVLGFVSKPRDVESELGSALGPCLEHAAWQARIRAFERTYGFGGDRVVFDFIPETTPTVASGRVVFSSVGIAVADGAAHATEPPILPEETRQEIDEFLELFLNPGRRAELGVTQPRGLLLYGPPGNGKTMIARHLAGRMRCNFLALSSGDFTSRWAGVAAERIKKLFAQARLRQPCVIFIDEIDGVVPKRSSGSGSGVERDQASTVAALLTELDGFDGGGDIFLIAATNRREAIDEALLRPGRLDRMIEVSCPGRDERQALLAASFARVEPHEVDLGWAANETFGFSCAQIVAAVRDSKLLVHRRSAAAASKEGCQITNADFREAVDCIRYGAAIRPDSMEARLLESAQAITAWHEAGHAVLSAALLGEIPERVTIVPRGHFGGYVRATREDQMRRAFSRTRTSCINELAMLLGGGIAESKLSDEHTSGVSSDRESAFQLAYRMVVSWGMGPFEAQVEGLLSRKGEASTAASSSGAVVREVSELLKEADVLARGELDLHEKLLQQIAQLLLEKKELDRSDLDNVLGEIKKQP